MPGKDPIGLVGTWALGVVGSIIGSVLLLLAYNLVTRRQAFG